jgi:molybdopterin/thiamine biosynthesis adenylyltransferase
MTEVVLAGCGAIGSRFADLVAGHVSLTCIDNQRVEPENLGIAAFTESDLGADKAQAVAERCRRRGGRARGIAGDVRYALRPGLARAAAAAVICLDNPRAVRDAAETLWAARTLLPVLVLTCGNEARSYQVRLLVTPGLCPACLFDAAQRYADTAALTASCVDSSAPRAAAAAAQAAAAAGARLLAGWRGGDRTLTNCRVQCDAGGPEYVVRMPEAPSLACPVPHGGVQADVPVVELGGSIAGVKVDTLARAAERFAGRDAVLLLGRRAAPLAGLYCPSCPTSAPTGPLLLPAAVNAWQGCACGVTPRPLGECTTLPVHRLLEPPVAALTLAEWGAGHGDEFTAVGQHGRVHLRCAFTWEDLDGQ